MNSAATSAARARALFVPLAWLAAWFLLGALAVRLLPLLTVMQFVSVRGDIQVVATFRSNTTVDFEFRNGEKYARCRGRLHHVRVDPISYHVPAVYGRVALDGACRGDMAGDLSGRLAPRFGFYYSMFEREATMYWFRQPEAGDAIPAALAAGDGGGESSPGPELFETLAMHLDWLRWLAWTTP
jgi:hypothetical protein